MKHPFQTLLEDADCGKIRSYSGRGMRGQECLGVYLDSDTSVGNLVSRVIDCLHDRVGDTDFESDESIRELDTEFYEAMSAFRNMSEDSLGLGTIVYFPRIPYTEE